MLPSAPGGEHAPENDTGDPRARARLSPRRDVLTRVRHDLGSTLHALLGYSDLLASERFGALNPEQARFVSHLRSAAEGMRELIDACIELSFPQPEPAPPALLALGTLLDRVRPALAERGLACDLRTTPSLMTHTVRVESESFQRALVALALVIAGPSGQSCTIETRAQDAGDISLRLASTEESTRDGALHTLEELERELPNRTFVRLKLAEVLLAKQDIGLVLTVDASAVVLTFGA